MENKSSTHYQKHSNSQSSYNKSQQYTHKYNADKKHYNPNYQPGNKNPNNPYTKRVPPHIQPHNQNQIQNTQEMIEIKEVYSKLLKKIQQYDEQNGDIRQDNKVKSRKLNELQKFSHNQQNKIQKIKNQIKLSLNIIEDTQESREDAEVILKENKICQNGDQTQQIQDLTVYSIIYSQTENKNIKFLIGKKRKREYWFPDSKKSGYKQLYKNGFILKQTYANQLSFPGTKFNTYFDSKEKDCQSNAITAIQHLFCFDLKKFNLLEAPKIYNHKHFSAYFIHVSEEDLEKINEQCSKVFKEMESVIEELQKDEQNEYDDSLQMHSKSYEKLMKKHGWVQRGDKWEFRNVGPAPSLPLFTSLYDIQIIDCEKDQELINNWKKPRSGLDWYYSIVDYLQTVSRNPKIEMDL